MNSRVRYVSMVLAMLALLSATGCVVRSREDVTFLWTFNGRPCALVPEVAQVTLQIPGQTLGNGGIYSCVGSTGVAGIVLENFTRGTYTYTIQGRNSAGAALYEASGSFVVNGDLADGVTVNADLAVNSGAPGEAQITWRFPASGISNTPRCDQAAGLPVKVLVRVDGDTTGQEFDCAVGDEVANPSTVGLHLTGLGAGTHTLDLSARDADGLWLYRKISSITVVAGGTTFNDFTFDWGVGGTAMKWTFNNGVTQVDCAQAGISMVSMQLRDSAGQDWFTPAAGIAVPCSAAGAQGLQYFYLYPGTYQVFLQAIGTGGALYTTNLTTPPTVMVGAGLFPVVDLTTQTFVLAP